MFFFIYLNYLSNAAVAMGPTGVCLLGAISVGLALLQYFNLIPSSVSDALNKFASWVTDAFDWFTGLFKSKPDAGKTEAGNIIKKIL